MTQRLILASNSTNPGEMYLGHLEPAIRTLFFGCATVAFVPYAVRELDAYATTAETRFESFGIHLSSVHRADDPSRAVLSADGVFVGGGNTFRLLDRMIQHDLIGAIRDRVGDGIPYLGTSVGSNVVCPSIRTTNDMPILQPPTFDSLGLVPFQINPHYIERDPDVPHGGETRRQRLAEFHEEADMPVVGLPEGSWLTIEDKVVLHGRRPALLFRRGSQPSEIGLGEIPWGASHERCATRPEKVIRSDDVGNVRRLRRKT